MSAGNKRRVFVSAPLLGDALARLESVANVDVGKTSIGVKELPSFDFDAVIAMLTDRIDDAFIARLPSLRLVANVAVGIDNVDLAACSARGVAVTNTPDVLTDATADLAFALLLAAARRVGEGARGLRAGSFPKWTLETMLGTAVHHRTLGLVGFGRIGQAMARRARGFEMNVLSPQRSPVAPSVEAALGATRVDLAELAARSDFVSLHCPLTKETRHLFDEARFARMKRGAVFVNTARGGCVDELALARALASGRLGGAGIDVFENEPTVAPELLAQPRAVLTPHVGSAELATRTEMARVAVDNVLAWIDGMPLLTRVT
ncbi:D-glycerate dehydrogenase [soil metagenome]